MARDQRECWDSWKHLQHDRSLCVKGWVSSYWTIVLRIEGRFIIHTHIYLWRKTSLRQQSVPYCICSSLCVRDQHNIFVFGETIFTNVQTTVSGEGYAEFPQIIVLSDRGNEQTSLGPRKTAEIPGEKAQICHSVCIQICAVLPQEIQGIKDRP